MEKLTFNFELTYFLWTSYLLSFINITYGALFLNCPNILYHVFRLSTYFQNLFAYLI